MKYCGKKISFEFEGESHSKEIKLNIYGIERNQKISLEKIKSDLFRRNPKLFFNTQRPENDDFEIIKGIENEKTTGETIEILFKNENYNKSPYNKNEGFLRPSHSDYSQLLLNKEIKTGGGEFSGRMTLPIVFAGSIFKQILESKNITIGSRIKQVYNLIDEELNEEILEKIKQNKNDNFPTTSNEFKNKVFELLNTIKKEKDSVGGVVETIVYNSPKGLGGANIEGIESKLSSLIYSIPAVKGVEFGDGFSITSKKGSESLDQFVFNGETILTKTNHNGGINGGVTNGMPIIVRTAIKPTPTIGKPITSYNYIKKKEETVVFNGNHDSFIVNRAIPSIEGLIAFLILDLIYEKE